MYWPFARIALPNDTRQYRRVGAQLASVPSRRAARVFGHRGQLSRETNPPEPDFFRGGLTDIISGPWGTFFPLNGQKRGRTVRIQN
jgi:hypothetical protein